jgi:hypothetical protein
MFCETKNYSVASWLPMGARLRFYGGARNARLHGGAKLFAPCIQSRNQPVDCDMEKVRTRFEPQVELRRSRNGWNQGTGGDGVPSVLIRDVSAFLCATPDRGLCRRCRLFRVIVGTKSNHATLCGVRPASLCFLRPDARSSAR